MRGEVGKQPKLGARQAHRPRAGRSLGRRHLLAQHSRVLYEDAHVRAEREHLVGLGQNRARGGRLAESEMGACELEPDLDRHPRKAVIEHGTQTMGARQRGASVRMPRLVDCDAGRRHVRERAR